MFFISLFLAIMTMLYKQWCCWAASACEWFEKKLRWSFLLLWLSPFLIIRAHNSTAHTAHSMSAIMSNDVRSANARGGDGPDARCDDALLIRTQRWPFPSWRTRMMREGVRAHHHHLLRRKFSWRIFIIIVDTGEQKSRTDASYSCSTAQNRIIICWMK